MSDELVSVCSFIQEDLPLDSGSKLVTIGAGWRPKPLTRSPVGCCPFRLPLSYISAET